MREWSRPSLRQPRPRNGRLHLEVELLESRALLTGTWTPLANLAPETGMSTMLLLTDGTVAAHASREGHMTRNWYRLLPDASGSYVNATWAPMASMRDVRVYYPSHVLPDGRLLVMGGEYGTGQRTSEIYDPTADTWTVLPPRLVAGGDIGDTPSAMLPDGRVLLSHRTSGANDIYDPWTNTWSRGGTRLGNQRANEDTWVLLPDQSVLTVDIFSPPNAQKYLPYEDRWVSAGRTPVSLVEGFELGPAVLLPDGRVFYVGANGRTALYTPPADPHDPGTWEAGATLPNNRGAWDAPGAVLPNGKVLLAVGPRNYQGPTTILEYDPATDSYEPVPSPSFPRPPYEGRMLMLPTGEVLWSSGEDQVWVYTPDGEPDRAWAPTITEITDLGGGAYYLTGTQLTGLNEGAAYGDDAEMSTNYPLVRLDDGQGNIYYATTSYWDYLGVMSGDLPVSTYFTLPYGIPPGTYALSVVTNGIPSDPVEFVVPGGDAPGPGPTSGRDGGAVVARLLDEAVHRAAQPPGVEQHLVSDALLPAVRAVEETGLSRAEGTGLHVLSAATARGRDLLFGADELFGGHGLGVPLLR